MYQETKPQAIYRAEFNHYMLMSWLMVAGFLAIVSHYVNPVASLQTSLVVSGFAGLIFWAMRYVADRQALLRCQRCGLLGYIRTREVIHRKPADFPGPVEFRRQIPLFGFQSPFSWILVGACIFLFDYWNSLPVFVPLIPGIGARLLLVATIGGLIYGVGHRVKYRVIQVDEKGVRGFFGNTPWGRIDSCVIIRDYGSESTTDERPILTARFYNGKGRPLATIRLTPSLAREGAEYVQLEETIYTYLGGRDPLANEASQIS
jgi:hypothetical protein